LRQGELHQLPRDRAYADHYQQKGVGEVDADSPWHHVLWNVLGG
jgi:hypothetical protein